MGNSVEADKPSTREDIERLAKASKKKDAEKSDNRPAILIFIGAAIGGVAGWMFGVVAAYPMIAPEIELGCGRTGWCIFPLGEGFSVIYSSGWFCALPLVLLLVGASSGAILVFLSGRIWRQFSGHGV